MGALKMNPDILTRSGHFFNFLEPEKSVICIKDIAHALSNINRFNGHTLFPYSVAQHSVLVSYLVPPEYAFEALMHDSAEAYIGDISTPLKQLLPDYKEIELRVETRVLSAFGLTPDLHPSVKHADRVMLITELRDVMPLHDDQWGVKQGIAPTIERITKMSYTEAQELFLKRFKELGGYERVAA